MVASAPNGAAAGRGGLLANGTNASRTSANLGVRSGAGGRRAALSLPGTDDGGDGDDGTFCFWVRMSDTYGDGWDSGYWEWRCVTR